MAGFDDPRQFTSQIDSSIHFSSVTDSLGHYKLDIVTEVDGADNTRPGSFYLEQNYPNPFESATTIPYGIIKESEVTLKIYNILGREVKSFQIGFQGKGIHKIIWDRTDNFDNKVAEGVYFYRISSGREIRTEKMICGLSNISINQHVISTGIYGAKANAGELVKANQALFNVSIRNTQTTLPRIIEEELTSIVIDNNKEQNFTVKEDLSDRTICYMKLVNKNWEIFLNNLAGTNPKNISNLPNEDSSPAWSSDGRYIAFTHFTNSGTDILFYDLVKDTLLELYSPT